MIPLNGDEIRLLCETRDLLKTKVGQGSPDDDLWLRDGYQGVVSVLRHAVVDVT